MDKGDRQNGSPAQVANNRDPLPAPRPAPGKATLTSQAAPGREATVQRKAASGTGAVQARARKDHTGDPWMDAAHRGAAAAASQEPVQAHGGMQAEDPAAVHQAAAAGVSGSGSKLPYFDRIQAAFGGHDVSGVQAHTGGAAADAAASMGAQAYATGNSVAFGGTPDLHTAAHEAAHIVQQRAGVQLQGGVGQSGDHYERHADQVADAVVRGESAEDLLGPAAGSSAGKSVQKSVVQKDGEDPAEAPKPEAKDSLTASDLVLSRDPTYAANGYLPWFRDQVKAKVESWGLPFDPAAVRLLGDAVNGATVPVVALRWNATWGTQPATREVPFSMAPVDARASVAGAQALPGWGKMAAGDKSILENMLGGETNRLSQASRDHLRPQFAGLGAKTAEQQATTLTGIITAKDALPDVADEQVAATTVKYELKGPTEQKGYAFRGITADAEKWDVVFTDGVQFEIVAPKAPQAGMHYHTVQQAADAASHLPKAARSVIKTVLLNAVVNPDDAYWATEYKQADFHSYMTAGAAGVVTIYPNVAAKPLPGDNYMRGTMIHETGHTWSYKTWGEDKTKGKWVEWQTAMTKDKASLSGYAMASIAEDVAETIQVYVSTKGAPQFEEYRRIVPNRFDMLDKEYK
jgi:hypothetical protein